MIATKARPKTRSSTLPGVRGLGVLPRRRHPRRVRPQARRVRAAVVFIESYRELPLLAWPRLAIPWWSSNSACSSGTVTRMAERIMPAGRDRWVGWRGLPRDSHPRAIFVELWAVCTVPCPDAAFAL